MPGDDSDLRSAPLYLLTYTEDGGALGLIARACQRAGWESLPGGGVHPVAHAGIVTLPIEDQHFVNIIEKHDQGDVNLGVIGTEAEIHYVGELYPRAYTAPFKREWDDEELVYWLTDWLVATATRYEGPAGSSRSAIEALYREVELGIVENAYLKKFIADLVSQLVGVTGQLTEAQLEIRTLEALHAQLERQNEALLKELSKGTVQPESASLLARGIKFGAVSLVSLAITVGGTYAGTKAALPDDQVAQLQVTQQVIVNQCDQVIQVVGGGE